jgi:hypothetical protein
MIRQSSSCSVPEPRRVCHDRRRVRRLHLQRNLGGFGLRGDRPGAFLDDRLRLDAARLQGDPAGGKLGQVKGGVDLVRRVLGD